MIFISIKFGKGIKYSIIFLLLKFYSLLVKGDKFSIKIRVGSSVVLNRRRYIVIRLIFLLN